MKYLTDRRTSVQPAKGKRYERQQTTILTGSCHVLYSGRVGEIQAKIALHYPETEREAVWERVQLQYVEFLSDWRTDLGGSKNFHNGAGGTYDCIAIMSCYAVCRDICFISGDRGNRENLILPAFRKLSRFVDCNSPFLRS